MEKEFIIGRMEESMLECIMRIKNKDLALIIGWTGEDSKESGRMEKEMEQER